MHSEWVTPSISTLSIYVGDAASRSIFPNAYNVSVYRSAKKFKQLPHVSHVTEMLQHVDAFVNIGCAYAGEWA